MDFLQSILLLVRKMLSLPLIWTINLSVMLIAIVLLFLLVTLVVLTKIVEFISDETTYNNWTNKWRNHVSNTRIRRKKN